MSDKNKSDVDVLAAMDEAQCAIERAYGRRAREVKDLIKARAAVADLIAERDALAKWQGEVAPLLRAAQSWMPTRKCAASIREIDAALARCKGA